MAESINDFFEEHAQEVTGTGEAPTPAPPVPPKSRREMRSRRKRRHRQHTLAIVIAVVLVVAVIVGAFLGYRKVVSLREANERAQQASQIQDYKPGTEGDPVSFTVRQGEDVVSIAKGLAAAGIVKSEAAFISVASGPSTVLYPGTFELFMHMDAASVLAILSDQSKATGFLDVKAGERVSAVIANAAELSGIDLAAFQAIVDGGGQGILPAEAGGKFEGWLEPGQYDAKSAKNASALLKEMVDRRIAKLAQLGVPGGDQRERILNMASIAEAEVNQPDDYGKVVRVILNRLDKGMTLGMDSTVAYGNDVAPSKLTDQMLSDASNPYNTRQRKGLPPTPISNPGDNAIKAALDPPEGDWLYFVTTDLSTGETEFTDNDADFEKLVQKYKTQNENAN